MMPNLDPASFDRTDFLPYHEGPNVLPHDILFHILHSLAAYQNDEAIIDAKAGYTATHQQFLSDIVACRNALRETLAPETIKALQEDREVSILILSSGYEFIVSFFAVLAIGAIAVPLSMYKLHIFCFSCLSYPYFERKKLTIFFSKVSKYPARKCHISPRPPPHKPFSATTNLRAWRVKSNRSLRLGLSSKSYHLLNSVSHL
jgi:hypothetical protein